MKNVRKMAELAKLTELKYQKAAQNFAVVKQQDDRLAAEFEKLRQKLTVGIGRDVSLSEMSVHEANKANWYYWVMTQQMQLNETRLATKISLEQKRKDLAFAAGQRDVSGKLAAKLRTEALKRLAARDQ